MAELIKAEALDFIGGQDASKIPDKVPDNAYYAGINVTTKRGSIGPRWGFERITLTYPEGGVYDANGNYRAYKELFDGGKFQALIPYNVNGVPFVVVVVSGLIYLLDLTTFRLSLIPISDGSYINARSPRVNWSSAGKYLVIFDFPAFPVIVEGVTARRADPLNYEVPAARIGTFNQNRLFIANLRNDFTAGDPVGNVATGVDAPITFQEILLPSSPYYGQIFQLTTGHENDPITAMGFLQMSDTSTGIGPLIISSTNALYTYGTNQARSSWEAGQFGSCLLYNVGIAGPRALVNANSDAFFIANDGYVRTLSMSRTEQQRWSKVPLSREVEIWMKKHDPSLIQYAFCGYFNNKVFFGCNPYRVSVTDFATRGPIADYAHGGMVVLELDNVTSYGDATRPTWAGLWTGVHPMDMVTIGERCFIMSKDNYTINRFYEVNPNINYDKSDCLVRYVRSRVYTKEYDFTDPFQMKKLHSMDFNFDLILGDFKFEVKYKPSHGPHFHEWRVWTHKAPWRSCTMPDDRFMNGFNHQVIRDLTIGTPAGEGTDCDEVTGELYQMFRKVQLQITFEGIDWELHEYRVKATAAPQSQQEVHGCEEYPVLGVPVVCEDDWITEDFEVCQTKTT